MFRYVKDVSSLSHDIIKNYCKTYKIAVDATLGNGHDTEFLKELFEKVYSFDIQQYAIDKYSRNSTCSNVKLIHDSHENFKNYIEEPVDCFVYNLGFLPGGDKNITTQSESTLISIKQAITLLKNGGLILISIYPGHEEGKKEKESILNFLTSLPKNEYGVLIHEFINRTNNPPVLVVLEKK